MEDDPKNLEESQEQEKLQNLDSSQRLAEINRLRALHKKALARRAKRIHRSTRTFMKRFEPLHFKLRDEYKWYYKWHTSRLLLLFHWIIFISAFSGTVYLVILSQQATKEKNSIPEKRLLVSGPESSSDKFAIEDEKSNITLSSSKIELENKSITIGIVKKKADLEGLVSWKNVSFSADIPEGTSIVYRIRTSNEDKEEFWEKTPWSEYYPVCGNEVKTKGIPFFKDQYFQIEIILDGNKKESPTLSYLEFGYTPFRENKVAAFIKDKIISGVAKVYNLIKKREGM